MPEALFHQIDSEKRERIIRAGIAEFADQSYNEASTNAIVQAAGISKGSLFKYFTDKEELYFYLLDEVVSGLIAGVSTEAQALKGDVFEVILRYAELEFSWHMEHPVEYRFLKRAFAPDATDIHRKTGERYGAVGQSMFDHLLSGMETERLRWDRERTVRLLQWFLQGFNEDFVRRYAACESIPELKERYISEISQYMEMIKKGVDTDV